MKASEIPSRAIVPQPFASGVGAAYSPISSISVPNAPSFPDGFPSSFSAPASNNGNYVTRGQMNAIGRIASQADFFGALGQHWTFSAAFASAVGGYPEGAILWYYNGGILRPVVSLIDDNMTDFTQVGVDGVNWKYANNVSASAQYPSWDRRAAGSIFGTITAIPTAGWVDLTGWRTVPHDGWIRMAFNVAPSAAAQKTEIVLVAGNSSGETPNVTTSDLTQGIDPLDRTLNYELFDFFNQGDTNNVLVPLAAGTKVGLFVYTDATDRPSSFQITDYFYAPAS